MAIYGMLCFRILLVVKLATLVFSSEADLNEQCSSAYNSCSNSTIQLRWRGYPYYISHPKFARTIYGGDYIQVAFEEGGFKGPVEGEDWDVLWTHRPQHHKLVDVFLPPRTNRRLVNHCNTFSAAGDKCAFSRISRKASTRLAESSLGYKHFKSYELDNSEQYEQWRKEVRADLSKHWVLKPCAAGGSQGIQVARGDDALFRATQEVGKNVVAQEYLENPFLGFGGHKFHLRMYIFATRWSPAAVYLYDAGLIFRSLHPFQEKPTVSRDIFSGISESVEALPLAALWDHLDAKTEIEKGKASAATVSLRIKQLLVELIESQMGEPTWGDRTRSEDARAYGCFDLFGADVILDSELRPYVMEINDGPNLWISNHGKKHEAGLSAVKDPLIKQVISWLNSRIRGLPNTESDFDEIERMTLHNFTRLI